VLGFLENSKSIQQPIERWSVIWNQESAKELKAGLAREVLKFEASKVASHSPSVDSLDALLSNRRVVWNAPDFEVRCWDDYHRWHARHVTSNAWVSLFCCASVRLCIRLWSQK
jgi:hypothetical protein